jgi:hypothetical protein
MANRANIQWHLHNMKAGYPGGEPEPIVLHRTQAGITYCVGDTVPTGAGYAPGCIFVHHDAASSDYGYINNGTVTTADFEKICDVNNVVDLIQAEYLASAADDGGGSPLIWDDSQLLEVMLDPSKGYYFFTDFMEGDYTTAASLWTVTQRTSGSIANAVEQGGTCTIDAGAATAAQGVTCQMHGLSIKPEAGTTIRMEWRMKCDEDAGRIAMGLGAVGTTDWVSDASIATNADCALLFRDGGTGATDWSYIHSDGSTNQTEDDVFTASDTGYETFGIVIVGDGTTATDSITYYRNGVASSAAATDVGDMPDAVMVPTFDVNADGTDQPVVVLDWLRILVTNATDGSRA